MGFRRGVQMMLTIALVASLFSLVGPPTAEATSYRQIECQSGGSRNFDVATLNDFNAAIACFNAGTPGPGEYRISLTADIDRILDIADAQVGAFTAIDQSNPDQSLVVDGNRFALGYRQSDPGLGRRVDAVVSIAASNSAPITFTDVEVEGRDIFDRLIWNQGTGSVVVEDSHLAHERGPQVAIQADDLSSLTLMNTALRGDIRIASGAVSIDSSTVIGAHSLILTGTQAQLSIVNSTFESSTLTSGAAIQVLESASVTGQVNNSTFIGDAFMSEDPANFTVTFRSSLVAGSCAPGVFDGGNNVGGCFASPIEVGDLRYSGCYRPAARGCVPTVALASDSPAIAAGDCSGLSTDQRGYPRVPAGPGCDAGAREALDHKPVTVECTVGGSREFLVGTEVDFNAAINCLNEGTPGPGSYLITLQSNVILERGVQGEVAMATSIDQRSPGFDLTIDGNGHTLFASDSGSLFFDPPPPGNQLATAETNMAALTIIDIELRSQSFTISNILLHRSDTRLTIMSSSIGLTRFIESSLTADGDGEVIIIGSILGGNTGVFIIGPEAIVRDSYFPSPDPLRPVLSLGYDGDSLVVSNSTFGAAVLFEAGATADFHNSTFVRLGLIGADLSRVTSASNIMNECGDTVVDAGNNVGGCFGTPIEIAAPADNGCAVLTPSGCPFTVALPADSPAVGAGLCSGVALDQRGEPRTPIGLGCDAGAFETPGFDPAVDARGDVDRSGIADGDDVSALLDYLAGNSMPALLAAGDLNGDGEIRLDDVLLLAQEV